MAALLQVAGTGLFKQAAKAEGVKDGACPSPVPCGWGRAMVSLRRQKGMGNILKDRSLSRSESSQAQQTIISLWALVELSGRL